MQSRPVVLAVLALLAAGLAGCGGGKSSSSTTTATTQISAEAEAAYEHSYSECASFSRKRLAEKYHVRNTETAVVNAVGIAWTKRYGGGQETFRVSKAGCRDGFSTRAPAS